MAEEKLDGREDNLVLVVEKRRNYSNGNERRKSTGSRLKRLALERADTIRVKCSSPWVIGGSGLPDAKKRARFT